jgi:hypothetical protein
VIFAAGDGTSLNGVVFTLDWQSGAYSELVNTTINIHDVQRAYSRDAFWTTQVRPMAAPPSLSS